MNKVKVFKNGAWVSCVRGEITGAYIIKAYSPTGALLDKIVCDDYRLANEYRRAFSALAKAA